MITGDQILCHLVGDYLLQSHWMATEKTKQSFAAAVHAATYSLPFLFLTRFGPALAVIIGTHFLIDRFRLARYVVWIKNGYWHLWKTPTTTGYRNDVPIWLSTWLLIITDNTLHLICNGVALGIPQ